MKVIRIPAKYTNLFPLEIGGYKVQLVEYNGNSYLPLTAFQWRELNKQLYHERYTDNAKRIKKILSTIAAYIRENPDKVFNVDDIVNP